MYLMLSFFWFLQYIYFQQRLLSLYFYPQHSQLEHINKSLRRKDTGAPSKAHTRQQVKILHEERLATTSELNPHSDWQQSDMKLGEGIPGHNAMIYLMTLLPLYRVNSRTRNFELERFIQVFISKHLTPEQISVCIYLDKPGINSSPR